MSDELTIRRLELVKELVWKADASTDSRAKMERLLRLFEQAYKVVSETMTSCEKKGG